MARSRELEPHRREIVARQLGELIGHHLPWGEATVDRAELAETFELFVIPGEEIPAAYQNGRDLYSLLRRTGIWHHQITSAGKPIGFAHSGAPGFASGDWSVQSFFLGSLAARVASAVAKLDTERAEDDIEVMLVSAPSYQVDFFLLRSGGGSEVLLIWSPSGMESLVLGTFYSADDFLRRLSAILPASVLTVDQK